VHVHDASWSSESHIGGQVMCPPLLIDPDATEWLATGERRYQMGPPPPIWIVEDDMQRRHEPLELVLYVSANSPACAKAIRTLNELFRHVPATYAHLAIVDVALNVEAATRDRVIFTPTLLCGRGIPRVRVIGDLSNREVLAELLHSVGLDLDGH
jgi:hypothetical protein